MLGTLAKAIRPVVLITVTTCATEPPSHLPEPVTYGMAREAQETAVRLAGGSLDDAKRPHLTILHASHEDLERRAGCPVHAAIIECHPRVGACVLWVDEARQWQSTAQGRGILIHEMVHALQMGRGTSVEREIEAHKVHAAYLLEHGEVETAAKVTNNLERYCHSLGLPP